MPVIHCPPNQPNGSDFTLAYSSGSGVAVYIVVRALYLVISVTDSTHGHGAASLADKVDCEPRGQVMKKRFLLCRYGARII